MSATWLVLDAEGVVVNSVEWDGSTPWMPPAGCSIVPGAANPGVGIGWTRDSTDWRTPATPDPESVEG
ncbi:hypothetical protein [Flavisphingomonas formosensis]|uniref:hypothetical protein n=1 Tax=Flavisphingomonas formosensis TaxID=861534 RepID=UPI0012F7CED0|nr:hypothetical protein [Sphingomonas formosensis]